MTHTHSEDHLPIGPRLTEQLLDFGSSHRAVAEASPIH